MSFCRLIASYINYLSDVSILVHRDKNNGFKTIYLSNRKEMLKDYIDYAIDNKLNGKW